MKHWEGDLVRANNKPASSEKRSGAQPVARIMSKSKRAKDLRRLVAKRSKGISKSDSWYKSAAEFVTIKAR